MAIKKTDRYPHPGKRKTPPKTINPTTPGNGLAPGKPHVDRVHHEGTEHMKPGAEMSAPKAAQAPVRLPEIPSENDSCTLIFSMENMEAMEKEPHATRTHVGSA